MKLICMTNMYIHTIQHGIQSAHAMADMFVKYQHAIDTEAYFALYDWARHHKTMIVLNCGSSAEMLKAEELCEKAEYPGFDQHPKLAWCSFREPDAEGLLTAVVYVEPDSHEELKNVIKLAPNFDNNSRWSKEEVELVKFSLTKGLAR